MTITPKDIIDGSCFGIAKVDITPPEGLYVPVLPHYLDNKLMFHLNEMTHCTWSPVELKRALEKGYVITKIDSALEYEKIQWAHEGVCG